MDSVPKVIGVLMMSLNEIDAAYLASHAITARWHLNLIAGHRPLCCTHAGGKGVWTLALTLIYSSLTMSASLLLLRCKAGTVLCNQVWDIGHSLPKPLLSVVDTEESLSESALVHGKRSVRADVPVVCFLTRRPAGDVLFVPAGCAHQVENIGDSTSIALSCNYVDSSNLHLATEALQHQVGNVEKHAGHDLYSFA